MTTVDAPRVDKFEELIVYIAHLSDGDRHFGATKLNKLLFYADFRAYVRLGKSITGAAYQKLPNGPAPRRLVPTIEQMIERGDVAQERHPPHSYRTHKIHPLREANLSDFSGEEVAIVVEVVDEFRQMNATEISNHSHRFRGWQLADENETIPYESALVQRIDSDVPFELSEEQKQQIIRAEAESA